MSLVPVTVPPQPAATLIAAAVVSNTTNMVSRLTTTYKNMYNQVWFNDKANPADIVSQMGTNAVTIFSASAALATLLNSLGANVVATIPNGYTVTPAQDGTASVTGSYVA